MTVVPFPLKRRRDFIERQAAYAAELRPDSAARHISRQIAIQGEALRRRGVAESLISSELAGLEEAINLAMWRVSKPGDVG